MAATGMASLHSSSTWRPMGTLRKAPKAAALLHARPGIERRALSNLGRLCGAPFRSATARYRRPVVVLAMAKPAPVKKEEHKIFDEVVITVRSGKGGDGEITQSGKGKWVPNYKYRPGGNSPKKIWLASGEPAPGIEGGSIILRVDPKTDALTHLHERQVYAATKGANGNPAIGSGGPKSKNTRDRYINRTPPVYISVPPGTEVRKKRGNWLLGELLQPGQTLIVARGGKGGHGVIAPSREQKFRKSEMAKRRADEEGYEEVVVEDTNWKADAFGEPGEELTIRLILRVVADVGIVGLPNAGKSSLLASSTRAKPEVAAYPFTTLMPNLGVMQAGSGAPVLADLPGLIEGAHEGRGLGFMFLRHLRRTRVLMHVVDAAEADPATDYFTVREELRMYNPEYTSRPHVVVLNKMDMEDAYELEEELRSGILAVSKRLSDENDGVPSLPAAIISTSAVSGQGIDELNAALKEALGVEDRLSAEEIGIDPEVLEQLKRDGFDVDKLDFADFK